MINLVLKLSVLLPVILVAGQLRVYHGQNAYPTMPHPNLPGFQTSRSTGEFPYMVSLESLGGGHTCGGALIKPDVVITAAHCTGKRIAQRMQIRAGHAVTGENSANVQVRKVKSYINHPQYDRKTIKNDIAIIKLVKPFQIGKYVGTINLPNHSSKFDGQKGLMMGWGQTENTRSSTFLKKAFIDILSFADCKNRLRFYQESMICGIDLDKQKTGVCSGDSGGPVVIHDEKNPANDIVFGINSWVIKPNEFCDTRFPSVFADVPYFVSWINENIK